VIQTFFPVTARLVITLAVVIGLLATSAFADVTLPNIFSDHMVLQRRQPNRVWGKAAPGEKVVVSIGGQSHEATAGADGAWHVTLRPMEAGEPRQMFVKGQGNEITVGDVLVGEVWVCSGQSNMEYALRTANGFEAERPTANLPQIRTINFPNVGSQQPIWTHANARWIVCTPESVGTFSAVGFFFARRIHEEVGVPVAIINNSWAGSRAEAWVPRKYFDGRENLMPIVERYDAFAKQLAEIEAKSQPSAEEQRRVRQLRTDVNGDDRPANAYNGIVASHTGYGIRGVLWYQGEGNTPRAHQYRELFPLLIESWRKEWGQGDFPFYWVQLPNYQAAKPEPGDSELAELREAQTMTLAKLPNTGEAVTIDTGDGDLHPRNKKDVGLRLALWALARDYGKDVPYRSPTYKSMRTELGRIILSFDHVNGSLQAREGQTLQGFAVAGEDRKFVWASATPNSDGTITVSSEKVPNPVAVRYAWADNPTANVYDGAKLPLTPFRTDDWPGLTFGVNVH
jgi:sialate O-acetylesterase